MSERREAPEPSAWRTKGGAVFPGQAWHDDEPLYTLDVVAEMLERESDATWEGCWTGSAHHFARWLREQAKEEKP